MGGLGVPMVGASLAAAVSRQRRIDRIVTLIIVLSGAIFFVDYATPRGIGIGMLYPLVILLALVSRSSRVVVRTAIGATIISWIGWFMSPEGAALIYTLPDRIISTIVLWAIALVGMRRLWVERLLEQAQGNNRWLVREVDNRVRDSLTTLAAVCEQGLSPEVYPDLAASRMRRRVRLMLAIHNLLARTGWGETPLEKLVEVVTPEALTGRISISGDTSRLPARVVQPMGLVLGELCWAVVDRRGQPAENSVWLQCRAEEDPASGAAVLHLWWREAPIPGAPKPTFPASVLELVQDVISRDLRGQMLINEGDHGVECEMIVPYEADRPVMD